MCDGFVKAKKTTQNYAMCFVIKENEYENYCSSAVLCIGSVFMCVSVCIVYISKRYTYKNMLKSTKLTLYNIAL